jgi:hypothetical protein
MKALHKRSLLMRNLNTTEQKSRQRHPVKEALSDASMILLQKIHIPNCSVVDPDPYGSASNCKVGSGSASK